MPDRPPANGWRPGRKLVDHQSEREEIAPAIQRLATQLLRRHVGGRPEARAVFGERRRAGRVRRERAREAEIQNLDLAVRPPHHILRLQIAMQDPAVVCQRQRARQRHGGLGDQGQGLPPAIDFLPQRLARDIFGRDEQLIADCSRA